MLRSEHVQLGNLFDEQRGTTNTKGRKREKASDAGGLPEGNKIDQICAGGKKIGTSGRGAFAQKGRTVKSPSGANYFGQKQDINVGQAKPSEDSERGYG